jgi:NADP-reducing hydrogenase subunit HndB
LVVTSGVSNFASEIPCSMSKIQSIDALNVLSNKLKSSSESLSDPKSPDRIIQVRVAMATCGIASGAKPVFEFLHEELAKRNIPARVTKSGCMCYCFAEPTIEVTIPGKEPVTFGFVDTKKADEIIEKFIRKGEEVEGVIPRDYVTVS